jgi:RNA methyltransferase, TrmH family
VGETAEPFSPKVVRSSAGTIFGVRVFPMTQGEVLALATDSDSVLIAATPHGMAATSALAEVGRYRRILLVVGSEADGVSEEILKTARIRIRIEHEEQVESLNVAVAGSILMKEIYSSCTEKK